MTEAEAGQRGIAVRVAMLPMTAVLRTHTTGETTGSMKVLVESVGDRILGFTMIGPEAGEVIAAVQTAMLCGLPYMLFRDAILTHPSMAEGLNALFASSAALSQNTPQKQSTESNEAAWLTGEKISALGGFH